MKTSFLTISTAIIGSFFSPLQAIDFDDEADQQILECVNSTEFCNTKVNYRFSGHEFAIYVLHNPTEKMVWGCGVASPKNWTLAMMSDMVLPFGIRWHLDDLIPGLKNRDESFSIELSGFSEISSETFAQIHPIDFAKTIDDPSLDAYVKELFNSNEFVNEVLHYHLGDQFYNVRILYNPQKDQFSASKSFRLRLGESLTPFSITWGYKYGIIADQDAPKELIDHLSRLASASWWDWYCNFDIQNGTFVKYSEWTTYSPNNTTVTTYTLDSWFNYLNDLQVK